MTTFVWPRGSIGLTLGRRLRAFVVLIILGSSPKQTTVLILYQHISPPAILFSSLFLRNGHCSIETGRVKYGNKISTSDASLVKSLPNFSW